jgi:WD40 repeat protein
MLGSLRTKGSCGACIILSSDGHTAAFENTDYSRVTLWDVATHRRLAALLSGPPGARVFGPFLNMVFSPDGRTLAVTVGDGTVDLWNAATHNRVVLRAGRPDAGPSAVLAFGPDGRTLATASEPGDTVQLWDVATGRRLASLRTDPFGSTVTLGSSLPYLRFSPDGHTLATLSPVAGPIRLFDIATHTRLGSLPSASVAGLAFSPDGRAIATLGTDGTVRLWNTATQRQLGSLVLGHPPPYSSRYLAFSSDGRTVAVADGDGTVRLWDAATDRQLTSLRVARARQGGTVSFELSRDGRTLATSAGGNTVTLWSGLLWRNFTQLRTLVCDLVGAGLSRSEWNRYAPGIHYERSCR